MYFENFPRKKGNILYYKSMAFRGIQYFYIKYRTPQNAILYAQYLSFEESPKRFRFTNPNRWIDAKEIDYLACDGTETFVYHQNLATWSLIKVMFRKLFCGCAS